MNNPEESTINRAPSHSFNESGAAAYGKQMYYAGLRDGIIRFAWWKDGTQYVGCGLLTLDQALKEVAKQEDV